jgi:tocopherol O-methyltransferase
MSNPLYQQIQKFYDDSSPLWEEIWGEHMHHGYYGKDGQVQINRRQAQINLIEELLLWSNIKNPDNAPQNILDVGCGIGGSTLYLSEKFSQTVTNAYGITLSPVQAKRAEERSKNANLADKVKFQVANALEMPFTDNTFDLVWSLESGEHMPDKEKFLQECYRVLKPGGRFILATWCHRPTNLPAGDLTVEERTHLEKIYHVYCLPYVISLPEYEDIINKCGFTNIKADDWSQAVAPFWKVVIDSAITPQAIIGLLKAGLNTINGALALNLMSQGYDTGLIRFGVVCASK